MIAAMLVILLPGTYDIGTVACDGGIGIHVRADDVTIRGGRVVGCDIGINAIGRIGLTVEGVEIVGGSHDGYVIGINGSPDLVEGNVFTGLHGAEAVAVLLSAGTDGAVIRDNRISNDRQDFDTIGIWIGAGSRDVMIEGNEISGFARAILADVTEDVTVTGNTLRGWSAPGTMGVHLWNCTGCTAEGNEISGFETLVNQQ